ncbi:MAG: hypothetical protein V3S51_07890 [Dehalococcoidia bacterium]
MAQLDCEEEYATDAKLVDTPRAHAYYYCPLPTGIAITAAHADEEEAQWGN